MTHRPAPRWDRTGSDPRYHKWNVERLPDANTAGLIGGLDETDPFFIGTGTSCDRPRDGQLTLGINDTVMNGNSGAFSVQVVSRPA